MRFDKKGERTSSAVRTPAKIGAGRAELQITEFPEGNSILTEVEELSRMPERMTVWELPSCGWAAKQEAVSTVRCRFPGRQQPVESHCVPRMLMHEVLESES